MPGSLKGIAARIFFGHQPDDISESRQRSINRYRKIASAGVGGIAAKGIGWLANFFLVPLTLNYLGSDQYGFYVTLSSLVTFLNFTDLGIGNGIVNAISSADGSDDRVLARRYVSSAFFLLSFLSIFLIAIFLISFPLIHWKELLNLNSSISLKETNLSILIFILSYLISIPFTLAQKILLGYQEGFQANIFTGISGAVSFIAVFIAIQLKTDIPGLILASTGSVLLVTIAANIYLFFIHKKWLLPAVSYMDKPTLRYIFKTSGLYFSLQIAGALAFSSSNVIILKLLDANQVTQFSIPQKLFQIIPTLVGFFMTPLWPAYGEALQRGDSFWVKKAFYRSILLGAILNIPLTTILVIFGIPILHLWAGPNVNPSFEFLLLLGISNLFNVVVGPIAMLMNGSSIIGFQVITSLLFGIATVFLTFLFVPTMGITGAIVASLIAQLFISIIPSYAYMLKMPYFSKQSESNK